MQNTYFVLVQENYYVSEFFQKSTIIRRQHIIEVKRDGKKFRRHLWHVFMHCPDGAHDLNMTLTYKLVHVHIHVYKSFIFHNSKLLQKGCVKSMTLYNMLVLNITNRKLGKLILFCDFRHVKGMRSIFTC